MDRPKALISITSGSLVGVDFWFALEFVYLTNKAIERGRTSNYIGHISPFTATA
jgi:hypothetical protein